MFFTLSDAIASLARFDTASPSGKVRVSAHNAAVAALEDLATVHDWNYYKSVGRLHVNGAYAQGTVTYSAVSREVTLSGGTWPEWSAYGELILNDIPYPVETRVSDSVVILEADRNPGVDITDASGYTLFRDTYPVPDGFRAADTLYSLTTGRVVDFVKPSEWLLTQRWLRSTSDIRQFTIVADPDGDGQLVFRFNWQPVQDEILDFYFQRVPAEPVHDYSTGTVEVTSGSASVVGTGTDWTDDMVGAVFRLGDANTVPTNARDGARAKLEARVVAVADETHLTLDTQSPVTATGRKYLVSDIIDIDQPVMLNLYKALCEKHYTESSRTKDIEAVLLRVQQRLVQAMGADSRYIGEVRTGFTPPTRLSDFRPIHDH